jgi:hypothetical protein
MDDTSGELRPQDRTDGPYHKPSGELGGHPVNADETAPAEHLPDAGSGTRDATGADASGNRNPDAVDDEPGSDL